MAFKIDFEDGNAVEWTATETGLRAETQTDYTPTIYANADAPTLDELAAELAARCDVVATAREHFRPAFRREPTTVLRIDVDSI
ncbi:MAG: DNA polymerase I, partial [Halovenus sp.]